MRRGWHCVLTKREQKDDDSSSFIGGKPCIPMDIPLPVCKICGEPLTFFFQIAFPKEHMWAGKSLAFFYCIRAYDKHNDAQQFPKLIGKNPVVADGVLEPDSYQTLFRAVYFDTEKGVVREDYKERVAYQRIDWVRIKKKDPYVPFTLAGEPVWMKYYGSERPKIYEGEKMELILQVAERFRFDKYPDAPSQMDELEPYPREEDNYTFFFDHNRVYLWATKERENPVFGLNVQPDF